MALQSSGSISFSQIANEFGFPPGRNLGAYRVNQNVGTLGNRPLDDGIPQSGQIAFSNFYGKRLNIVVDMFNIPQDTFRRDARNRYNNNGVVVIGGFRSRPSSSSGTKVTINVDRRVGSEKGNRNSVALKTGSWDSNTDLRLVVGPNGSLMGAGGDGGIGGGGGGAAGESGTQGSSALGIQYPTSIINQGFIFGGRGGGGGGAAGWGWTFGDTQRGCSGRQNETLRVGGGGGAGGRGFPPGNGGPARIGGRVARGASLNYAGNGGNGTVDSNGAGGAGGSTSGGNRCNRHAFSGSGGNIESAGSAGNVSYNNQGQGGQRGWGIIIGSGGSIISYSGNAELGGITNGSVN